MSKQEPFKKKIVPITILFFISLSIFALDTLNALNPLYTIIGYITNPVKYIIWQNSQKVSSLSDTLKNVSNLKTENEQLEKENTELLQQISLFEKCKSENEALKEQLKLNINDDFQLIEARVIGSSIHEDGTIQINKGTSSGINTNNAVVFGNSAVGIIKSATSNSSTVYVTIAPESNIPAYTQKNKSKGLLQGSLQEELVMKNILPNEKIDKDELVFTTGVNTQYPPDLIVGTVTDVYEKEAAVTKEATVKPIINFSELDYVFILVSN